MIAIADDAQVSNGTNIITPCVAVWATGLYPRPRYGAFDAVVAFNCCIATKQARRIHRSLLISCAPGGFSFEKTPCLAGFFRAFQPVFWPLAAIGKAPDFQFYNHRGGSGT